MNTVLFIFITCVGFLFGAENAQAQRPAPDVAAGKAAYEANCARCHGATGAGDGPDAGLMDPKPRRLSEGIFKFRTTASGTPPTDEDLFHTISTGLQGSRMPDFQRLPEETRWQLVAYIQSLSPVFEEQKPEPLDLGIDPGPKKVDPHRGKELYTQLGCVACHGTAGRGNGPSAPTLVDNWGQPIRAADLTQGWRYRSGSTPKDIVARLMTGIDGAPMPSYADAISKEDAWQLATYVHSLQETPRFGRTIEAVKVTEALPSSIQDARWSDAPRTDLRLTSAFYKGNQILPTTTTGISVQAMYNEGKILFRLSWHDPDENRDIPADAMGLLLAPDRRLKLQIGSLRSWPATPDGVPLDLCYWSAYRNEAREAVTVTTTGVESGEEVGDLLESEALYVDGQWTLLVKRPLEPQASGSLALRPQKPVLIGFSVWNGGNGESGRHRANSNWVDLVLK